tara:strand:- start:479 stop:2191 length:1713 start_codon:yes stop_codon:yes gene_type:complete
MSITLGFNLSHNGSVALISGGEVKSAVQAERIFRLKRCTLALNKDYKELFRGCIRYCLEAADVQLSDIEAIAFATPWSAQKIDNSDLFNYIGFRPSKYVKTFYVPHHYSHMEYIVHYGDSKPGIVLVIDGSGSVESDRSLFNIKEKHHSNIINYTSLTGKETISAYWFDGLTSSLIYRFSPSQLLSAKYNDKSWGLLQSIGHYWEWASSYCYGSMNEAGKVMGLAAYGVKENIHKKEILSISDYGKLSLDFKQIRKEFKNPNIFNSDLSNSKHHQNLALKVQSETECVILKLLSILKKKYPTDTLYFSGGVALNVVANEKIENSKLFKNVILNGSVEDNGTAIGAGLSASLALGYKRKFSVITDYYGRDYKHEEIISSISEFNFSYKVLDNKELYKVAANFIKNEKIFGWYQGRSEFGPRALGNRSILANPASPNTKHILDNYMKSRERFRPYAPVVTEEDANKYFDIDSSSPVMMRNAKVLDKRLTAITHFDKTARVQTVSKKENEILYLLLLEVKKNIGFPILLNTSFNLPGEPIVETPKDALSAFYRGSLDFLFIKNVLISREHLIP